MKRDRLLIEIRCGDRRMRKVAECVLATHQGGAIPISDNLTRLGRHKVHRYANTPVVRIVGSGRMGKPIVVQ